MSNNLLLGLLTLFYLDTIFWIGGFWLGADVTLSGSYTILFFVLGIYSLLRLDPKVQVFSSYKFTWALIFLASLQILNLLTFDIGLIGGTCFVLSLYLTLSRGLSKFSIHSFALVILSLPFVSYLNILVGYFLRLIYSHSLFAAFSSFNSDFALTDTILILGNRMVNIDSGCSGLANMYLLTGLTIFLSKYFSLDLRRTIFAILGINLIYFIINWIHLFVMVYFFTIVGNDEIRLIHENASILVSVFTFSILALAFHFFQIGKVVKIEVVQVEDFWASLSRSFRLDKLLVVLLSILLVLRVFVLYSASIPHEFSNFPAESVEISNLVKVEFSNDEKALLAQFNYIESMSKFELEGSDVIMGKVDSTMILSDILKYISLDGDRITFTNTVLIDGNLVRKVTLESGRVVYFATISSEGVYQAEFRYWDVFDGSTKVFVLSNDLEVLVAMSLQ